jgi:hypothetical protein
MTRMLAVLERVKNYILGLSRAFPGLKYKNVLFSVPVFQGSLDSGLFVRERLPFSMLHWILALVFLSLQNGLAQRNPPMPQQWGIGCYDNDCIWFTDSKLTSGEDFAVSTFAPGGAVLGTYSVRSVGNTITFRPNSSFELKLLNSQQGLHTLVSSAEDPVLAITAMNAVIATSSVPGEHELVLHLNGNPGFQSPSYTVLFLDAASQQQIGVAPNVSPKNRVLLSIDLQSVPAVARAYKSEGVFARILDAEGRQLNGEYYIHTGNFGMLDRFYRATQLQDNWTLLDQGLLNVQSGLYYLLADEVEVPYLPKFGANSTEVPFADSFVITHFLGGNPESAVTPICEQPHYRNEPYCSPAEPWSLDYVFAGENRLLYQSSLVYDRLDPYLKAGYRPSDITVGLDNVPWAIASNAPPQNGSTCVQQQGLRGTLGFYGDCNPPGDFELWGKVVEHLTDDLTAAYGAEGAQFRYEVGDEFDDSSTYNGHPNDFYQLYQSAFGAVHATFPNASVVPGDFSGSGSCWYPYFSQNLIVGCTYDTRDFLRHEIAMGMVPDYVPRSLNAFWDINHEPTPSSFAVAAISSYKYVETGTKEVIPEIHQFGFLDMPFGPVGDDTSSLSANWDFQLLLRLKQGLPDIRRVFNWGGVEEVSSAINFLNGNGWIREVFDNLQGWELFMLPVSYHGTLPPTNEVMAVAMVKENDFRVFISNFDLPTPSSDLSKMQFDPPVQLQVSLPAAWISTNPYSWSYLRYSESPVDNVFAQIKIDYEQQPNVILSQFAQCSVCFSSPLTMASNTTTARNILTANWTSGSDYVGIMQNSLKWRSVTSVNQSGRLNIDTNGVTHDFKQNGNLIMVAVGADEMLVLKPGSGK